MAKMTTGGVSGKAQARIEASEMWNLVVGKGEPATGTETSLRTFWGHL
jgi:hypothetical protein